jgi:hypothetical protein
LGIWFPLTTAPTPLLFHKLETASLSKLQSNQLAGEVIAIGAA